jgi:hypothetical protein
MAGPLPQAPGPDWRQYMLRAVIWVSFVAALGYAAAYGGLDFLENDVHLAAEPNRERVALAGEAPVIEVKVSLRNNTRDTVTLKADSACKMFRWQIFNRAGSMVQSKVNEDTCPSGAVTAILPPGEKLEEFYSIALVPTRLTAGQDYLVHYWYWGHEGEFEFAAE